MGVDLVADRPDGGCTDQGTVTLNRETQSQVFESGSVNPRHNLASQGIRAKKARYNASEAALLQTALAKSEGVLSQTGALVVTTGKFTDRSPDDKHIVLAETSRNDILVLSKRADKPNRAKTGPIGYS